MPQTIAHITLVVRDYDEAISFFTEFLGFDLIEDTPSKDRQGRDKRWVLIAPQGSRGTQILLAKASNEEESSRIGNQTGGRVFLFLHTDDLERDYRSMREKGGSSSGSQNKKDTEPLQSSKISTATGGTYFNRKRNRVS
jgi:catechol 2,3-dioxygenase-like lactoylglutathione lyase family enzyme